MHAAQITKFFYVFFLLYQAAIGFQKNVYDMNLNMVKLVQTL